MFVDFDQITEATSNDLNIYFLEIDNDFLKHGEILCLKVSLNSHSLVCPLTISFAFA